MLERRRKKISAPIWGAGACERWSYHVDALRMYEEPRAGTTDAGKHYHDMARVSANSCVRAVAMLSCIMPPSVWKTTPLA